MNIHQREHEGVVILDIDLETVMSDITEAFGAECLPINLPGNGGQDVADCFFSPQTDAARSASSTTPPSRPMIPAQRFPRAMRTAPVRVAMSIMAAATRPA